jgi:hypothetical protein
MFAMEQQTLDASIRQSAAIAFKNFIKKRWDSDNGISQISDADRVAIKSQSKLFLFATSSAFFGLLHFHSC